VTGKGKDTSYHFRCRGYASEVLLCEEQPHFPPNFLIHSDTKRSW